MSGLQVIARADTVLRALEAHGPLSVADLAATIESPTSSTYRLLRQLTGAGWVEPAPRRGEYRLGPYVLKVAAKVEKLLDVRTLAREPMAQLVGATGCASTLLIARGDRAVCVERRVPAAANTLTPQIGDSVPLFAGAGALLLLAHMSGREREESLATYVGWERDLIPVDLEERIARARASHLVRGHDELFGTATLAAPIRNHRRELVAALSVHGVRGQLDGADHADSAAAPLEDAAAALSLSLGSEVEA